MCMWIVYPLGRSLGKLDTVQIHGLISQCLMVAIQYLYTSIPIICCLNSLPRAPILTSGEKSTIGQLHCSYMTLNKVTFWPGFIETRYFTDLIKSLSVCWVHGSITLPVSLLVCFDLFCLMQIKKYISSVIPNTPPSKQLWKVILGMVGVCHKVCWH